MAAKDLSARDIETVMTSLLPDARLAGMERDEPHSKRSVIRPAAASAALARKPIIQYCDVDARARQGIGRCGINNEP